jgi:RecA-family ATPase
MTATPEFDIEELARSRFVRLSDVEPEQVAWLWQGRVPLGKVCILDGDPGLGKSTLVLGEMASRVTTGSPWPDGAPCPRGAVVMLTAEDGLGDTIRPRLDAHGADSSRVVAFEAVEYGPDEERLPSLALDVARIEAAVVREGALLVVIDVLMAYLGNRTDAYRDQDVRSLLTPLVKMAERTGCAVICLRHLSKTGGANALYRGGGSIGIIGAARAGLLVALDPEDETRRVLAVTKNNLAAPVPALAFRLVPDEARGCARIEWDGETAHTASQLLETGDGEERSSAGDEAVAFLLDLLAGGSMPANKVKAAAKDAGIAPRTLDRAKGRAGVEAKREGFGSDGVWSWSLSATPNPKDAIERRTPSTAPYGALSDPVATNGSEP